MIRKLIALLLISTAIHAQEITPVPSPNIGSAPPLILDALAALNSSLGTSLVLNDLVAYSWAEEVFADISLGCPQQGQSYAQTTTRGYVFIFVYDNITYDYRAASDGTSLFLCESTPLQAAPTHVNTPAESGVVIDANNAANLSEVQQIEVEGLINALWVDDEQFAAIGDDGLALYGLDTEPTPFDSGETTLTALAANDSSIVVGGEQGEVVLFSIDGDTVNLESINEAIDALTISPDGVLIVAGTESGLSFYNAQSGAVLTTYESPNPITSLTFRVRGEELLLASGDGEGAIRLYEVTVDTSESLSITYTEIDVIAGHTERINDLAFSPDGSRLASASDDQSARLWNTSLGAEIANLSSGAESAVVSVALNGDVLAAAEGNSIRLWDVTDVQDTAIIGTLTGHEGEILHLDFSPKGTLILSAGSDNTVRLWGDEDAVDD